MRLARFRGGPGRVRVALRGRVRVSRFSDRSDWVRLARFGAGRRVVRRKVGRVMRGRARFAHCKAGIGTVSGASEPGWSRVAFCVGRRGLRVLGRAELKKRPSLHEIGRYGRLGNGTLSSLRL